MTARTERRSYRWLNEPAELPACLSFAFELFGVGLGAAEKVGALRRMPPHGWGKRSEVFEPLALRVNRGLSGCFVIEGKIGALTPPLIFELAPDPRVFGE